MKILCRIADRNNGMGDAFVVSDCYTTAFTFKPGFGRTDADRVMFTHVFVIVVGRFAQ